MRAAAVLAAVLLVSGCTWVRKEFSPPPTAPAPMPKPEPAAPAKPRPRVERQSAPAPLPQSQAQVPSTALAPTPADYASRCQTMAANRADDARGLGASPAEQAKIKDDTYRDCMSQSVK